MKVVVLVPSLQEKGPNVVAKSIALNSKNKNIEYIFCSLRNNSEELLDDYRSKNLKVIEIGFGKVPKINEVILLRKKIKDIKPDIIHAHTFWPTIIAGFFLKKFTRVTTIHNNPIEDYSYEYGKITGFLMSQLFNYALKSYEIVIPISRYVESKINDLKKNNIKMIHNGIEDRFFLTKSLSEDSFLNLLTVSVLNKRKDVIRILQILAQMKKQYPNHIVKCTIIGEGIEFEAIQKYIYDNNIENEITLLGNQPRDKVFDYMSKSDAFIFTSKSEGFGLVVVESLMMGKPVIVNDIPVMREIVDSSVGFISKENSEFIESIKQLFDVDLRKKLSLQSREKYMENFTIELMVEKYESLYHYLS